MKDAITFKEIYLSIPGFLYIRDLEIREQPGKHSMITIEAVMEATNSEQLFFEIPEMLSVHYMVDGKERILFKGVISDCTLSIEGKYQILKIEARDATYWMDIDRKNRCFQNTNITVSEVMKEIMKGYGKSDFICNLPDEPIGELLFQYEETDWEFLNRFFSRYHDYLYPSATFQTIHYQAGCSIQDEKVFWDKLPFKKRKDFGQLEYLKRNGLYSLLSAQCLLYDLESYDIVSLGSRVYYRGNYWYISAIQRKLSHGLLVNSYELRQKESMWLERYYNSQLTGISMYAVAVNTQRDRLQAVMQNEALGENCYWFPFSSVSSSSDGSGWYCMPEPGESVRIYFPTAKEAEAYVITCIQGHAPAGKDDPMGNPDVRSISTDSNLIQFDEDGILIAAKQGDAKVSLKKDGLVCISAPEGIDISPEAECKFSSNKVDFAATTSIQINDDSGASITAGAAGMFLNGQEIYEN